MASEGNSRLKEGIRKDDGNVLVVQFKTDWNGAITDALAEGSENELIQAGYDVKTYTVPGAVELPFAVQHHYHDAVEEAAAYIVFGCVVRGDTPHFEYVCSAVTQGVATLNTQLPVPVIFGVLTVNTQAQAEERIGGTHGHKGQEAAITALRMIALSTQWKEADPA